MEGTFEFKLKGGSVCTIEVTYECIMGNEIVDADGDKIILDPKPTDVGRCQMVAYVDGRKVDSSKNSAFWRLVDTPEGMKKIWGLKIGFSNSEDAERYEKWISGIIESGKTDEVRAYEKAEKEVKIKEKLERAKKTIIKAERQKDIPTKAEAKRRMKQYNDVMNEGGEGYVPCIISLDEYEHAKEIVKKYQNIEME